MSKLVNPLLSQDARGSVSGIQFSRNRAGSFASRKSTSTRAQGEGPTNFRAQIKRAHTAWNSLSSSLKQSWETYAHARETGRNAFIGCCLRLFSAGQAAPDVSPLTAAEGPMPYDFHWDADVFGPGTDQLTWEPPSFNGDWAIFSFAPMYAAKIPHVRKFSFFSAALTLDQNDIFTTTWHPPWLALRVQVAQRHSGVLLFDRRWVFDPTQDQDLLPDHL